MRKAIVLSVALVFVLGFSAWALAAEITITHMAYQHSGANYHDYMQKKAEEFNRTHPGIKVEIIIGVQDQLATMIAGGVPPDVIDLPDFAHLGPAGQLVNLKPLMERDGITRLYNPAVLRGLTINDAIYTMPSQLAMFITYFNRDLFDQAGLITPDKMGAAWDWDQVISAGKKLTVDRDGDGRGEFYGFDRPWGAGWRLAVLQFGGWFYAYDNMMQPIKSLWNSKEVLAAIQTYERIFTERITPHLAMSSADEQRYYFWTGNTAIDIQDGLTIIGNYLKNTSFEWDLALLPRGPAGPITIGGGTGPSIMAATKHVNEAWEWVKFFTANKENAEALAVATGGFPALLSAQQIYPVLTDTTNKNYRAIFEQATYVQPPEASYPLSNDLNPRRVDMSPIWKGATPAINHLETIHQQKQAIIDEMLAAKK
ncbi:MAG TPA: extracellular solute-binding protein [Firmicutes bacterium]|nr:extracellular solute-binding protein [Bacillota bacterium]